MRKLNLVFQGGGVKGIAYAGVLQSLPHDCEIKGVGGTSAGALVAALIAIGKRGPELENILKDRELFSLLETVEVERYSRLKGILSGDGSDWRSAFDDVRDLWADYEKPGMFGFRRLQIPGKLTRFKQKHRALLELLPAVWQDVSDCWQNKGAYSSLKLRKWLNKHLEDKNFGDIREIDLRIVATDVARRSYSIFIASERKGESIAHAVHASVSIPLFFEPLIFGTECLVDGGILSNYPKFLFAQSPYPTVGFQLKENIEKTDFGSTLGYLVQLLETMVAAHDKRRKDPPHFKSYEIETPKYIPFDKFALEEQDVNELYFRGLAKGKSIPWNDSKHSSDDELVSFYDPRPDDVLHQALVQANVLVAEHLSRPNWVEELVHSARLQVRIESDWSARYDRRDEIKVIGQKPLFLQRLIVKVPKEVGRLKSLADTEPKCIEELDGKKKPLAFLPLFNGEDGKGFVVFYSPPIQSGEPGPRTISTSMRISQEFESVGLGAEGEISMNMTRRAEIHRISGALEILIHKSLPDLEFFPNFDYKYTNAIETLAGKKYERHTWVFSQATHENIGFPLKIKFRVCGATESGDKGD